MKKWTLYTNRDQELVALVFFLPRWIPLPASEPGGTETTTQSSSNMMTSWHGNAFRITGPSWGESTGYRWIIFTKGQWRGLWCSFYVNLTKIWANSRAAGDLRHHDAYCNVIVMIVPDNITRSHHIIHSDRQNITRFVTTSTVTLFKPQEVRFIRLSDFIVNIIVSNFILYLLMNSDINRKKQRNYKHDVCYCTASFDISMFIPVLMHIDFINRLVALIKILYVLHPTGNLAGCANIAFNLTASLVPGLLGCARRQKNRAPCPSLRETLPPDGRPGVGRCQKKQGILS